MTCNHDHIYTDINRLFDRLGLTKKRFDKTKLPLLWISDELYDELKSEGLIKEQTNENGR